MARFSVCHAAAAGTDLVLLMVYPFSAPRRGWVYDILIGSSSTPGNLSGRFDMPRGEDIGDGGPVVAARALDPADSGSSRMQASGGPFTVTPPTITPNSSMLSIGLHQRQTFRWVGRRGRELVFPAISGASVAVRSVSHGGTPTMQITMHWDE